MESLKFVFKHNENWRNSFSNLPRLFVLKDCTLTVEVFVNGIFKNVFLKCNENWQNSFLNLVCLFLFQETHLRWIFW